MSPTMSVLYDPHLIEEAVFLTHRDTGGPAEIPKERERVYKVADPEERERLFGELNRSWFVRLKLAAPIEQALQEQPSIAGHVASCFVVCAAQAKEEGAELFVAPQAHPVRIARRTLRILLRPESLLNPEPLLNFLRRELFHIADMLDPTFNYEPTLPKTEGGPTYDGLITNRYRVLWDITINGRMARRGWISESIRAEKLSEFLRAFPILGEKGEKVFSRFFDNDHPTHPELAAFAFDPRAAIGAPNGASAPGTRCPLCRFPTHAFEPGPENLGRQVIAAIERDFPQWTPSAGLCAQCADLYRANQLSVEAARALPGWQSYP